MSNNYRTEIKVILTRIMVESLCVYPFFIFFKKKSSWERSFSPAERVANFLKHVSAVRRTCSTINVNYKTTFFFFILGVGTHWAPRGISGDSVPLRKRVVRLLLQAVTSECLRKREKKRESEREQGRGREGGKKRQWMREGEGGCCRLKKQKSCSVLSQEDFGSGGGTGELCLTPASHMSLTQSFKQ